MAAGGGWLAVAIPAVTLTATLPFIGPNHTQAAPPVRMIRWLEKLYPIDQRRYVYLFLRDDYGMPNGMTRTFTCSRQSRSAC